MCDHYESYEELYAAVLCGLGNDRKGKARVEEEDELFRSRGWEDYILYLYNTLSVLPEKSGVYLRGSALDSYLLGFALGFRFHGGTGEGLLLSERKKGVLFHDALRLFVYAHRDFDRKASEETMAHLLWDMMDADLNDTPMIVPNIFPFECGNQDAYARLHVVGKDRTPDERLFGLLLNEKRDEKEKGEELSLLRENLLIYQLFFGGI